MLGEGSGLLARRGLQGPAKQFKRLKTVLKRQRTILGVVVREITRKMGAARRAEQVMVELSTLLQSAELIRTQKTNDEDKMYVMHIPELDCIGKGKARRPYEFGVKASIAVIHGKGLVVGARTFPGNPYDGHILAARIEQTSTLLQDIGAKPITAIVDLGYRGVDAQVSGIKVIHRGQAKRLTARQKVWLRRRQAVKPVIGQVKADHRMYRCWLNGAEGDALHAVLCAAGFDIRWLMRAILAQAAKAAKAFFFVLAWLTAFLQMLLGGLQAGVQRAPEATSQWAPQWRIGVRPFHGLVDSAFK